MPSAVSPPAVAEPTNYDRDVDDFLRDLPLNNDAPLTTTTTAPPADPDAEIKIRKKRAPVLKLDEFLLLSPAGIPKLRSHARSSTHLKFKGKGHEFSDMGRLLHMYQLWLDDLYPKAKFRDGLAMVEKVGHGKRMAVMRRGWMDGSKPGRGEEGMETVGDKDGDGDGDLGMTGGLGAVGGVGDDLFGEGGDAQAGAGQGEDRRGDVEVPEEDELDALMGETANTAPRTKPQQQNRAPFEDDDGPDDDELDALMGQETNATTGSTHQPQMQALFQEDDEDDEDALDALMAESARPASAPNVVGIAHSNKPFQDEDDEDELNALLAEQG
ncbi:chromosome segregation in meiosis-related protein [Friedmanniomyces endolithicus]|nr:chromosome segregation in meiosis-related protein [Friedmanniomyces endolithicus]